MPRIDTTPVALVTGAGRRLGRQIALGLAADGFDIAVHYHRSRDGAVRTVKDIQRMGRRAVAIRADISKKSQVEKMVRHVHAYFNKIDLLVNNAAIFVTVRLESISEKMWDAVVDTNLKGTFLCAQAVAPLMLKRRQGRIVNIASLGGLQAWSTHLPYSVSKAGVIMLTKCLAKSLAPHIPVNAIAPGTIIMEGEEDPHQEHVPEEKILLQRYGIPPDITHAVRFLALDASYMTGQVIVVDGGRSIQ